MGTGYVLLPKRRFIALGFAMLIMALLACMCTLDRSGIVDPSRPRPAPDHSFSVRPRTLVCSSEVDQVTVSWEVAQPDGCTHSPGLTSCDAITEFFFGCPAPPVRCNNVGVVSEPDVIDPSVGREESSGSRTVTLTETTTFTLSANGEELESITVEVIDTGGTAEPVPAEIDRTCVGGELLVEELDLTQMFSQCVQVGPICNASGAPIVLTNRETREEHRLEPGACMPVPVGEPDIWLVREEAPILTDPCATSDGSVVVPGTDVRPLDPLQVIVQVETCDPWSEEFMECLGVTSEPLTGSTPAPTLPPGSGGSPPGSEPEADPCAANEGTVWSGNVCLCSGLVDFHIECADGRDIDQLTGETCTPSADCAPSDGGEPSAQPGAQPGGNVCENSCGNGNCEASCGEDNWTCSADCGPG